MDMRPSVIYTLCDTSLREKTGDIITFAQFKDGGLLSETREDAEIECKSGEESDDNSIMPPLLGVEETNVLDYGNESDDEPMSTELIEEIRDGNQSRLNVNRREARYNKRGCIRQRQSEWKGALKSTQNLGKSLH